RPDLRLPGPPQPRRARGGHPGAVRRAERQAPRPPRLPSDGGPARPLGARDHRLGRHPGGGRRAGPARRGAAQRHREARGPRGRAAAPRQRPRRGRGRAAGAPRRRGRAGAHAGRAQPLRGRPRFRAHRPGGGVALRPGRAAGRLAGGGAGVTSARPPAGERAAAREPWHAAEPVLRFPRTPPGGAPAQRWRGAALMGVVNVTPDSFSDGGATYAAEAAVAAGLRLAAEGALIVDVGGESTRPGAAAVDADEELARVLPVVAALAERGVVVSVDTRKPLVAERALAAGAALVNDVSGLRDPRMVAVCAAAGAPAVIVHMRGEPATMQQDPRYDDVVADVGAYLAAAAGRALDAGVPSV